MIYITIVQLEYFKGGISDKPVIITLVCKYLPLEQIINHHIKISRNKRTL